MILRELYWLALQYLDNMIFFIFPIGPEQGFLLRQILLAGLPDHVARKIPKEELPEGADKKKFGYAYFTRLMEQPVFLHNMSVLKSRDPPEWVVYQEVYEVQVKLLFIPPTFFVWRYLEMLSHSL